MKISFLFLFLIFSVNIYSQESTNKNVSKESKNKGINDLSVEEMITFTSKGNDNVLLTIGIIKNGEITYNVYGRDGLLLEPIEYDYEIGSITKTFTTALLCKAFEEEKIKIDTSISKYIRLPEKEYYPSIKILATHKSGYGQRLSVSMVFNTILRKNPYYGYNNKQLEKKVAMISLENKEYKWEYSNFGMAILGDILGKVYNNSYIEVMSSFITDELNLHNTKFNIKSKPEYWQWKSDDAFLAAGGLISNVSDMLKYAKIHIDNSISYIKQSHNELVKIGKEEKSGMRFDAIGLGWIIDNENHIIWHNGGTSNYNSYIGIDCERRIAVVVLLNKSPSYRIPACVIGTKLLKTLQN